MNKTETNRANYLKKFVACTISAVLLVTAPGLGSYRALAQVTQATGQGVVTGPFVLPGAVSATFGLPVQGLNIDVLNKGVSGGLNLSLTKLGHVRTPLYPNLSNRSFPRIHRNQGPAEARTSSHWVSPSPGDSWFDSGSLRRLPGAAAVAIFERFSGTALKKVVKPDASFEESASMSGSVFDGGQARPGLVKVFGSAPAGLSAGLQANSSRRSDFAGEWAKKFRKAVRKRFSPGEAFHRKASQSHRGKLISRLLKQGLERGFLMKLGEDEYLYAVPKRINRFPGDLARNIISEAAKGRMQEGVFHFNARNYWGAADMLESAMHNYLSWGGALKSRNGAIYENYLMARALSRNAAAAYFSQSLDHYRGYLVEKHWGSERGKALVAAIDNVRRNYLHKVVYAVGRAELVPSQKILSDMNLLLGQVRDMVLWNYSRNEGEKIRAQFVTGLLERYVESVQSSAAGTIGASRPVVRRPAVGLGLAASGSSSRESQTQGFGKAIVNVFVSFLRLASGAGMGYGLGLAAMYFLPGAFGLIPDASLWAIFPAVVLLPLALYARYRLAVHSDLPRLGRVRALTDFVIGAFLGGAATVFPQFLPIVPSTGLMKLSLGPLLGLVMLPAMTTVAFFLGYIVKSAKSGDALKLGSSMPIRWPTFFWTGFGAVFALLSGFTAPGLYINIAFGAWMFLGKSRIFNFAYLGALGYSVVMGWATPITLIVLAFAPERMAMLTEYVLGKLLPKGKPAPEETRPVTPDVISVLKGKVKSIGLFLAKTYPNYHIWLKTGLLLGTMFGLALFTGFYVFGITSLLKNVGIAGAIAFLSFWFSSKIVVLAMGAKEAKKSEYPGLYKMVREIAGKYNAPMPKLYIVPMGVPNAFATGRSPKSAIVGVTPEILALLDQREIKGVLGHEMTHIMNRDMLTSTVAGSFASGIRFAAYGILWSVTAKAMGASIIQSLVIGAVLGVVTYVLSAWLGSRFKRRNRAMRRDVAEVEPSAGQDSKRRFRPSWFEPASATVVLKSVPGMLRLMASLFAPIVAQIVQMAITRTREFGADEGGAKVTDDPLALANALDKLSKWKAQSRFRFWERVRMPLVLAMSHIFTVSPREQLDYQPVRSRIVRWFLGDNFLFNLFVTHPPTKERIRRLKEMSGDKEES